MFTPNTKVFSKTLGKTDAKKRLAVPTRSMGSLPSFNGSHGIRIGLICGTKTWPIQYTISKNGPNKRPSFTSGWTQFVACNGLKCGDEISLHKVGSFLYRIEVETPVDAGNKHKALPSHVLSLNHEVGARTMRVNSDGQNSKAGQVLRTNPKEIIKLIPVGCSGFTKDMDMGEVQGKETTEKPSSPVSPLKVVKRLK